MKITLTNAFHNTEAHVVPRNGKVSARALLTAGNKLCSQNDCKCTATPPKGWVIDWGEDCKPFLREAGAQ